MCSDRFEEDAFEVMWLVVVGIFTGEFGGGDENLLWAIEDEGDVDFGSGGETDV